MRLRSSNIQLIGLFLVALLLYWPAFSMPFMSDDYGILNTWKTLVDPISGSRWRPVLGILFGISRRFFGLSALPLHLFSFALLLVLLMLYIRSVEILTGKRTIAMLAALFLLFFYRMPTLLYWTGANTDLLVATFGLGTVLAFFRFREVRKPWWLLLSLGLFLFALLSKETAIVILLFLPVWYFLFESAQRKRDTKSFILAFASFVFIALLYWGVVLLRGNNGSAGFFMRTGGSMLLSSNQILQQFANMYRGLLPVNMDYQPINSIIGNWSVIAVVTIGFFIFLFSNRLPKAIRFFGLWALLGPLPYGLFAAIPMEHYFLWAALGFIPLLILLADALPKRLRFLSRNVASAMMWTMLGLWLIISWRFFQHRSHQWQQAGVEVKRVVYDLQNIRPSLPPNSSLVTVDFPGQYNDQVHLFSEGLVDLMVLLNRPTQTFQIIRDREQISSFLKEASQGGGTEDHRVLFYDGERIRDVSSSYDEVEQKIQKLLGPEDVRQRFLDPNFWITGQKTDSSKIKVKGEEGNVILHYYLPAGDWVYALLAETPILPETKVITLEIRGQGKHEKLYIDLFDSDSGGYFRWSTYVDWDGWRHLDLPLQTFKAAGAKAISFSDVDSLKISIESYATLAGEIQLRWYDQLQEDGGEE